MGGGVNINSIYYTVVSKVLCLTFVQSREDSSMQIIFGNPGEKVLIDGHGLGNFTEAEGVAFCMVTSKCLLTFRYTR